LLSSLKFTKTRNQDIAIATSSNKI